MAEGRDASASSSAVTTMTTTTTTQQQPNHPPSIQLQQHPLSADNPPSPPPIPSSDPRLGLLISGDGASPPVASDENDLFKVKPLEALRMLSASVELLVRMTGDVPPTPPPRTPTNPQMSDMQAEKDKIVRTHSEKSLIRLRQQAERDDAAKARKLQPHGASSTQFNAQQQNPTPASAAVPDQGIDGVRLKPTSPPARPENEPYVIVGADSQPINLQHGAITRKFYSKNEPPITINEYLLRLHRFCPMSTAVYLATSLYIHRLAVEERAIPVTKRNAHRLVLAGLRVAMKALEDLSYSHSKIARVGGVSAVELARLEISFCFLAGFELVVGEEPLKKHWETLRGDRAQLALKATEVPTLRLGRQPREMAAKVG